MRYRSGSVTQQAQIADPFGLVGTTLEGQYRVDRVIGEGGFGVVYKGWHLSFDQPIAIKALKVMVEDHEVQEKLLAKFREEATLLYTLSQASLHIVRSIGFGGVHTASGAWAPYMILEWLEGRTFAEDLEDRRSRGLRGRTIEEALALLTPVVEGLSVAHQRRVAHRDLKPANLFLVNGAGAPNVKVLDFGIAKILQEGEQNGTKSPFATFTFLYAAPEQLDPRHGSTGLATDVYAFCLVLTELLTDRSPVEGNDVLTIMKVTTDPLVRPTPRTRGAPVTDAVEAVCRRGLAVDPRARYPNIDELWAALKGAATQRLSAPPMVAAPTTLASPGGGHALPTPPPGSMPAQQRPSYAMPHAPSGPYAAPQVQVPAPMVPYTQPSQQRPGPPVTGPYPVRKILPTAHNNSGTIVLFVVLMVLSGIFVTTCAVFHAACG
jgi:eukaryotic-like serine/threonine-protein kinase